MALGDRWALEDQPSYLKNRRLNVSFSAHRAWDGLLPAGKRWERGKQKTGDGSLLAGGQGQGGAPNRLGWDGGPTAPHHQDNAAGRAEAGCRLAGSIQHM